MAWHFSASGFCLLGRKHGHTYIRMIYEINKGIIALGLTWNTYKGRNRTNEVRKDNQILNAKVKYLESNKDAKAIDDFLTLLREICQKPTF